MNEARDHLTGEQLVDHFYSIREKNAGAPAPQVVAHLGDCAECRANFEALERTLAAVDAAPVPERGDDYGREIWRRLEPQLGPRPGRAWRYDWGAWFAPRRLVFAGAMAALLVAAFFAGRTTTLRPNRPGGNGIDVASAAQGRDRILLVAVGEHLERSQMVLVELVNANPGGGPLDIATEQHRAEDLVAANRLYRQTALRAGETGVASVLDELERVLVEIANSPARVSSPQLAELRKRIESRGILFKIRVIGSEVRERQKTAAQPGAPRKTS
jgi:hypothetical protein